MSKPRMCPHCRAFVDPGEKICPYCGDEMGHSYRQRTQADDRPRGFVPQTHFTTLILLLINFGLFAAMMLLSQKLGSTDFFGVDTRVADVFGMKERYAVLAGGQWWRLVTAGFLHAGIFHILMNSWVLFDLGAQVEHIFGTARFLVIYLASSAFGFLASLYWTPDPSMGASAALCGLIGAMMAYGRRTGQSFIWSFYLRWIIMIGVIGLIIPVIDNAAHFGGLAAGYVIGWIGASPRVSRDIDSLWASFAGVCVLVTAACLYTAYRTIAHALSAM